MFAHKIKICVESRFFCEKERLNEEPEVRKRGTVIRKAIEVLIKELGPVETIRFINIPKKKRMESVKRHHNGRRH